MTTIQAFIERHPVLTYFVLTFMISWTGLVAVVGPDSLPLSWERFERLGLLLYVVALAGPCLAGILMTVLTHGRAGLRELLARLRRWRVGVRWYTVALLPVLVMAVTCLGLSLLSPEFVPAIFSAEGKAGILLSAVAASLLFGVFEEVGWTGFAVPRLRSRYAVVTTGLTVGLVWGAWHFPLFWESSTFSGALPLAVLLAAGLPGADGVGLRSYWQPARGGAHARQCHYQRDNHGASNVSRGAPFDLYPRRVRRMVGRRGSRHAGQPRANLAATAP